MNAATDSYLAGKGGIPEWFTSTDHKKISLMFLGWTGFAFLLGAIFGLFLIVKSLGGRGLEPRFVFQALTYSRLLLVFLFLVPALPSVLGFFLLPLQLGASNMALPNLSRCSLRFYVIGLVLLIASLVGGPIATGWTMAAPLVVAETGLFALVAFGLFFSALSWFLTGVNFLVTVHHSRTRDMGFFDMPILSWALYLTGYLLVISGSLFAVVILYLVASRFSGEGIFGADPMLWNNYFWFVTTPAAFFALLPAVGVISEVIAGISRKRVAGYRMVVGSMIALLGLSFLGWGVNLVGQGQDPITTLVFQALGILAVVPVALIAYSWLATLYQGAVAREAVVVFVFAFMVHAGIVALMGLFLISPAVGAYLGTTMFAATRLDYLIWGGVLSALLAGLHYWWPKMTGKDYSQDVARIGGVLYLVGLNLALIPNLILGVGGVTGDMAAFEAGPSGLAELAGLGWLIVYAGLALVAGNLFASTWGQATDDVNPWGASTLEWKTNTPPPDGNFAEAPQVEGLYRY
jgi:cytochrome c oxidase subunit 1